MGDGRRLGSTALYVYISNDFVHDQITLNTPLQAAACTMGSATGGTGGRIPSNQKVGGGIMPCVPPIMMVSQ